MGSYRAQNQQRRSKGCLIPLLLLTAGTCVLCCGGLLIAGILGETNSNGPSNRSPESSNQNENNAQATHTFRKGETGYLQVEGENAVWLAVDSKANSEMISLSSAKNRIGLEQMMAQGRLLVCIKRTRVTIVDPGFTTTTVRVLEGKHEGRTGIIANEFLKSK